tara:strand:+ start:21993 stop:22166 length:174 start_codon:yes stop_codon:yes gene_type:complete
MMQSFIKQQGINSEKYEIRNVGKKIFLTDTSDTAQKMELIFTAYHPRGTNNDIHKTM